MTCSSLEHKIKKPTDPIDIKKKNTTSNKGLEQHERMMTVFKNNYPFKALKIRLKAKGKVTRI